MKKELFVIILALFVLVISGCEYLPVCGNNLCEEGETYESGCLDCGCPSGKRVYQGECIESIECSDGTMHPECSSEKPYQCLNGFLVEKASVCGCKADEIPDGENCVSRYLTNPKNFEVKYTLRGRSVKISFTVYKGLNDYLEGLPRTYTCYNHVCPSEREIELRFLNEERQKEFLLPLADEIRKRTDNNDDRARIAISLVQHIPYDMGGLYLDRLTGRYPYEVVYDNAGVCGEKSKLAAFLLRDLGYEVVLFTFEKENHQALGIKCPAEYSFRNSGYCFVETTRPTIITFSSGDYLDGVKLVSDPEIITINSGKSFDSVSEEYDDAAEFEKILSMGTVLPIYEYRRWVSLSNKYGMQSSQY